MSINNFLARLPDKGFGGIEIGLDRGRRGKAFERVGNAGKKGGQFGSGNV